MAKYYLKMKYENGRGSAVCDNRDLADDVVAREKARVPRPGGLGKLLRLTVTHRKEVVLDLEFDA